MRSRHGPTFPFATMDAIEWRFALKEAWVIDATTGDHFYPPDTVGRWVGGLCFHQHRVGSFSPLLKNTLIPLRNVRVTSHWSDELLPNPHSQHVASSIEGAQRSTRSDLPPPFNPIQNVTVKRLKLLIHRGVVPNDKNRRHNVKKRVEDRFDSSVLCFRRQKKHIWDEQVGTAPSRASLLAPDQTLHAILVGLSQTIPRSTQ